MRICQVYHLPGPLYTALPTALHGREGGGQESKLQTANIIGQKSVVDWSDVDPDKVECYRTLQQPQY